MTTCKIQWVDKSTGRATLDNNPAVAIATVTFFRRDGSVNDALTQSFPICAEHLDRAPCEPSYRDDGTIFSVWSYGPVEAVAS